MAVIEYDEYKQKLLALEPTLGELEKALGIPKAREELAQLQKETEQEGFWNDLERSQQVSRQVKRLENKIKKHDKLVSEWEDTLTLCEMAQEEDDPSQLEEVTNGYETLEKEISERRLAALLSGEYDANNAILTFHAGAGGTEAQDWTEMLYRMYTRWAERHGYTYQLMDYEAGDEAGIKSATILIEGENAYGYLKSENGVHRLVRVSPFDANARRQTSFAALEVMPELDDDSEIEIRPEDIEMQACRSSGAGGQHINKTSSAVRLTHLPTGIVVFCQTERSQFQNRDNAMKMLKAKLAELKLQQHAEKISDIKGVQMKIEWGSQIRSYVFMPYTLAIRARAAQEPALLHMGTTLVAAAARPELAVVTNIGDSRAYLISREGIRQISKDHSLVENMVDHGELTPQQARKHPSRNLITRALGPEAAVQADTFPVQWKQGDFLLLCSDGLVNTVTDQEILFEVIHGGALEECLQRLLALSRQRGAPDNVTAILLMNI